jgi:tetratricopeptide (TPR) repeat protein
MIRQIWQRILNLWRQIQRRFRKPAPPPPKPTPIRTFEECEQKFMALLEGVEQGWSRGEIKGFLIGSKINDAEWVNWLQEFGDRLLVSPENHLELGRRMVRLGEMDCGRISEVAGNIGRELLAGESLNRNPVEESLQIREDIQELPEKTEETGFFPVSGGVAESIEREISQEVEELFNQAVDNYEFGYLESALAYYDKVIEMQPDFYQAWINRSKVLDRLGRYQEATTNYYTAIALQSGNKKVFSDNWFEMGVSPTDNSFVDNQGNCISLSKYEVTMLSEYGVTIFSAEREISQEAEELFNQGVECYLTGDLEGAIAVLKKVLEIDPKSHLAWYNLGYALNDLTRYIEAIEAYETALKIDPKDPIDPKYPRTWLGLGNALRGLERYTEAEVALKQALEIDPKYHIAWSNLGNILKYLGRYKEAIAAFEKALEIDPKYHAAWNGLGATLNDLGGDKKAIAAFEKALEIDPKSHITWSNLGTTLTNFGQYSEAIAAFDRALEITGEQYRDAWVNRGFAFFNSWRYIEAIQNWDEGLQKYLPSNRDYRLACGQLHQQKGKAHYEHGKETFTYFESFHKAKASYEQARDFLKSPLIPETYLEVMQGLITVCRSLGYPKTSEYLAEATTVLETLLLDNETHPEIKQRLQRKFAGLYQLEVDILVEAGDKVNALEKAESRKNFCLQWMRATSPNPTASPAYPQIRDLLANNTATAIIYWHLSPVSLTAFIITPDKFEVISTPVTDIFAKRHSQSLEKWLENWKTNYQNYCQTTSKQQTKESHPWRESMTAQLQQLADILKIPEICTHLTNIQHLILIPHRDLHLLPLDSLFLPPFPLEGVGTGGVGTGALPLQNPGRGNPPVVAPIIGTGALPLQNPGRGNPPVVAPIIGTGALPLQNPGRGNPVVAPIIRSITRLPSAQIAIQQQQQTPTEIGTNSLVIIGKTDYEYPPIEAAAISQINQTHRPSNASTKTAIIQALKASSSVFHYTGHAYHNTEKSEASALMLAKNEELTLTDILQLKFVNYYLVCLSACETGITKKGELIDEFVGIASGFLPETNYVISTLWRAEERSSAFLMIYFYQLWKQGIQPPEALQQAKDWLRELTNGKLGEWYAGELLPLLRNAEFDNKVDILYSCGIDASILQENLATIDEKPYEHPYYWAAFNITGNG